MLTIIIGLIIIPDIVKEKDIKDHLDMHRLFMSALLFWNNVERKAVDYIKHLCVMCVSNARGDSYCPHHIRKRFVDVLFYWTDIIFSGEYKLKETFRTIHFGLRYATRTS